MTQKEFMDINIPIIKERKDISYRICDGVVVTFASDKNGNKYRLLLNGYEVARNQNYSTYSIKGCFLYIKNNARSFQWIPIGPGLDYAIDRKIALNVGRYYELVVDWENVSIVEE